MRSILIAALASSALATFAWAQGHEPYAPVEPRTTSPDSALDNFPNKVLDNGGISAKV